MSRKHGDRIRLLDDDSSHHHDDGPAANAGPGVNRLGDLLGGAQLPPPAEFHVSIDKQQVRSRLSAPFSTSTPARDALSSQSAFAESLCHIDE